MAEDTGELGAQVIDLASITDEEWYEVGRRAVEDLLIELRDSRISLLGRNNGLVVKERDGSGSATIRLTIEHALKVGMTAIFESRLSASTEGER
jgi:hypothetical protein